MKRTAKDSEMTLLRAMEKIVEVSKNSKMKPTALRKVKTEIKYLAERYGITEQQAVIFCVCLEKGPRRVDYDDLASYLDINRIGIFNYASDIDALVRRRLLKFRDVKDEEDFDVPTAVLRMLRHNEVCTFKIEVQDIPIPSFHLSEAPRSVAERTSDKWKAVNPPVTQ